MKRALKIVGEQCIYRVYQSVSALFGNHSLARRLAQESEKIPKSNGVRYYSLLPYKIGIIADLFLYCDYQDTCDLRYIGPNSTEEELYDLDLLLITSVWHGLYGEWTGAWKDGAKSNLRIHEIAQLCRRKGIPVAFYSKEDPPNFGYFKNLAKDADYIFTSAEELIDTYRRVFPKKLAFHLPFCTNPKLYNPIGAFRQWDTRQNVGHTAVFAGSYMPKYPNRIQDQDALFRWCRQAGLKLRIVDRNYRRDNPRYLYPVRYWPLVLPDIDYRFLGDIYKLHAYALNLNSVTESESMFAKRVYDALACGSVVISNESRGMERAFPEVAVALGLEDIIRVLSESEEERHLRRVTGVRRVMSKNTSFDRVRQLLSDCKLFTGEEAKTVAVIVHPKTEYPKKVREMFHQQTYPHKCLIDAPEKEPLLHSCPMVAIWTDKREYGPHFLEDMVNAFRYTNCRYVVKNFRPQTSGATWREEHAYVEEVYDKYGAVFWQTNSWPGNLETLPESFSATGGYSPDILNYHG